jgi:hypothetical protein
VTEVGIPRFQRSDIQKKTAQAVTPLSRGFFLYLRSLLIRQADLLCPVMAGPVFFQLGATFDEPTVDWYEPTEGATTDPYPSVPVVCAIATVLVRANAVASAIVVTFMAVSFAFR